jgi:hypothetical protein
VAPGETVSVEGVNAKFFMLTTSALAGRELVAGEEVEDPWAVETAAAGDAVLAP